MTSTLTFAATANAIVYTGAEPYFVDCDPETATWTRSCWRGPEPPARRGPPRSGGHPGGHARQVRGLRRDRGASPSVRRPGALRRRRVVRCDATRAARRVLRRRGGALVQRQQDHDHVRRRDAADRRRALAAPRPQAVDPGAGAGRRTTSTPRSATTTGCPTSWPRSAAPSSRGLDEMMKRRREWRERYRELFADVDGVVHRRGRERRRGQLLAHRDRRSTKRDRVVARPVASGISSAAHIETRPVWKPMHLQPVFEGL